MHKDSRGFTGFFVCDCREHAYHSNCENCNCKPWKGYEEAYNNVLLKGDKSEEEGQ